MRQWEQEIGEAMEEKQSAAVADEETGSEPEVGGPLAKLKRFALPLIAGLVLVLIAGGGFAFWSAKKHRAEAEQQLAAKKAEAAEKEAAEAAKARELAAELHKQHQAVLEGAAPASTPREDTEPEKSSESAESKGETAKKDEPAAAEKAAEAASAKKIQTGQLAAEVKAPSTIPVPEAGAKKPPPANLCTVRAGEAGDGLAQCLEAFNKLDRR